MSKSICFYFAFYTRNLSIHCQRTLSFVLIIWKNFQLGTKKSATQCQNALQLRKLVQGLAAVPQSHQALHGSHTVSPRHIMLKECGNDPRRNIDDRQNMENFIS